MEPLVRVSDLSFSHGHGGQTQRVLSELTFELKPGELVVLTGPSGSGKSTLLTIIGGLRRATEGSVVALEAELVGARERQRIRLRRRIGFIFQQHNLAPALSVAQNIQMGLQLSGGHKRKDARAQIERIGERVGLAEHLHKLPAQLSGGQQQRAGIARALVHSPSLVLADEPTASLDRAAGQLVMDLFADLVAAGSAVVLVTHDKRILDQAHRVLIMEDGMLVPSSDQYMRDTSDSLRKLMDIDAPRLGRMMSFAQVLAQVALADGQVDAAERTAMREALLGQKVFSGAEVELVVDLALAQAQAWSQTSASAEGLNTLQRAAEAVAMADDVVTAEEKQVIQRMLEQARRQ